jgi:hypothetical protein
MTIEHFQQERNQLQADAAEAKRQHVCTQQQHGPDFASGEGSADAAGVTANKVPLQIPEFSALNMNLGQLAESGAYAVNDGIPSDDLLNQCVRTGYARLHIRRQPHAFVVTGDAVQLGQ